jgi:hypothetical protein
MFSITACLGSGDHVLCEVVQNFGLQMFKLGEILFFVFPTQVKYTCNKYTAVIYLTVDRSSQMLYSEVCFFGGTFKKSLSESATGHQAMFTNYELTLIVPEI